MKRASARPGLVLLGVLALAAGASPPKPAKRPAVVDSAQVVALLEGMRNATCPVPGVAIGGQPDSTHLVALGKARFRTVVDMRTAEEARGYDEPGAARAAGLSYRLIPVGRERIPDSTFDSFRKLMNDSTSHPVLVHCASGNRVGPVLISWLVLDRGWPKERAIEAARQGGLRSAELQARASEYIEQRRRR